FSLFLQAQLDFALNSLEIHKGFLRLFALNPACACEIFVIFFVFRYTLALPAAPEGKNSVTCIVPDSAPGCKPFGKTGGAGTMFAQIDFQ
ncbi:MAG: hypothetical protein UEK48_02595, partial [Faecalibacterium prausnitzii]|nr:hypothetical protein [Faecalibacterium prausnitzii]